MNVSYIAAILNMNIVYVMAQELITNHHLALSNLLQNNESPVILYYRNIRYLAHYSFGNR